MTRRKETEARLPEWKLINVDDIECTLDKSGVYTIIVWQNQTNTARIDIMSSNHDPIVSFAGSADNVRKHTMKFLSDNYPGVSLEHASYIGSELERADTLRIDYVQDRPKAWVLKTWLKKLSNAPAEYIGTDDL